ncbi:MAG: NAD(P)/FAD-dependent oxidoreductase [Anaerovoracaceae bacterium]
MTDIFIIGSGPAGISAAVYAVRAGLSVAVTGKDMGALAKTDKIENYYGFPEPVSGPELHRRGIDQAKRLGVEILSHEVFGIEYRYADSSADPDSDDASNHFILSTSGGTRKAKAVILAAGTSRKAPPVPGLKEFEGKGVSYCAVCDAFFYRDLKVAVMGNGEYAVSEAKHLLPTSSEVTILTNGRDMEAEIPDGIHVRTEKIVAVTGEAVTTGVEFEDGSRLDADGIFVAEGTASATDLARKLGVVGGDGKLALNEDLSTFVPGFFAAGDCAGGMLQVAKAVYDGARAGTAAIRFIRSQK